MNIKKYNDPHENSGFRDAITHGVTEFLATATYSPDNLIIATEKKLEAMREIIDRDKTFWGRFKNWFNGEKPDRILVDGGMLIQLFDVSKQTCPYTLTPSHQYTLPYSDLYELYREILLVLAPEKTVKLDTES